MPGLKDVGTSLKVTVRIWVVKLVCPEPFRTTPEQQQQLGSGPAGPFTHPGPPAHLPVPNSSSPADR